MSRAAYRKARRIKTHHARRHHNGLLHCDCPEAQDALNAQLALMRERFKKTIEGWGTE